MGISSQQAVERALRQVKKQGVKLSREEANLLRSTLSVVANDALEMMGKRVAEGDAYEGMQIDYSVTPVLGFVDLRALTGILFDIDRSRVRVSSSNLTLRPIDSYETLENGGLATDQVYYAQDGPGLRFRDTSGSLVAYATAVKISSNYIPSFTDASYPIPRQFEGTLVSCMVELALGQLNPADSARVQAEVGSA